MRERAGPGPWRAPDREFRRGWAACLWPASACSLRVDCSPVLRSATTRALIVASTALKKVALVDDLGEIKRLLARNEPGRLQRLEDVGEARFRDRQILRENLQPRGILERPSRQGHRRFEFLRGDVRGLVRMRSHISLAGTKGAQDSRNQFAVLSGPPPLRVHARELVIWNVIQHWAGIVEAGGFGLVAQRKRLQANIDLAFFGHGKLEINQSNQYDMATGPE